jgi:hypothetical protein
LFYLALYQEHISRREKYVKEYMSIYRISQYIFT